MTSHRWLPLAAALLLPGLAHAQTRLPELALPERGLDDSAAYQGYQTRFYRDSRGNVLQIYLERHAGRVVNLWADAANESIGFTARDGAGRPAALSWGAVEATASDSGQRIRVMQYQLASDAPRLELGWFVLGSMRVERDFQYQRRHYLPYGSPAFQLPELVSAVDALEQLAPAEQERELALLNARSTAELRQRLVPKITTLSAGEVVRVQQPSFDARDTLSLELRVDPRDAVVRAAGRTVSLQSRHGTPLRFTVRIATDAGALTPLARDAIFDRAFLAFFDSAKAGDPRLERQVRSVELLSTREKLMAGLPNYATYFGRDMMMTALMMAPIWSPDMQELVIASVLRKLSPNGDVSHEEALGGQAIREGAAEYAGLLAERGRAAQRGDSAAADSLLARARAVLGDLQRTRENYHMMDDELQLPVLVARYLRDARVSTERKRAFLLATESGTTHLALLMRELDLVARLTAPYARDALATNLIGFPARDSTHWASASWRDSGAGYANGRFAMDINAIWTPLALGSIADVFRALREMGLARGDSVQAPGVVTGVAIARYLGDSTVLAHDRATWSGAMRHFIVRLSPAEVQGSVQARLRALPADEARYWGGIMAATHPAADSLVFLALSLDAAGRPIGVANTDPATRLFLMDLTPEVLAGRLPASDVLRDVSLFVRPYPVGLFIAGLGPVVANDAYAPPSVWSAFAKDLYHSPRVVWGREVNLILLGIANQIAGAYDSTGMLRSPMLVPYVRTLAAALRRTLAAVDASGLRQSELWSYRIEGGRLQPTRYGTSTDVQLWNTTSLAVQFALARLPREIFEEAR